MSELKQLEALFEQMPEGSGKEAVKEKIEKLKATEKSPKEEVEVQESVEEVVEEKPKKTRKPRAKKAAPKPKKGLTGDVHWQITRRDPAFTAGRPLPGTAHEVALGKPDGAIAQLGERLLCKQEVVGSIPSGSTNFLHLYQLCIGRFAVTELLCAIMANGLYLVSANQPKPCAWAKITHWQTR